MTKPEQVKQVVAALLGFEWQREETNLRVCYYRGVNVGHVLKGVNEWLAYSTRLRNRCWFTTLDRAMHWVEVNAIKEEVT